MNSPESLPRWVLLFHRSGRGLQRPDHWDLMIQNGGHLDTWAIDANPFRQPECRGIRLGPHRLEYLDRQGELSGERGTVQRLCQGNLLSCNRTDDGCGAYVLEFDSMPVQPVTIDILPADRSGGAVEAGDSVRVLLAD